MKRLQEYPNAFSGSDIQVDQSNVEDGLEDTPYCKAINTSYNFANYTDNQLEIIRKNLTLMEH